MTPEQLSGREVPTGCAPPELQLTGRSAAAEPSRAQTRPEGLQRGRG